MRFVSNDKVKRRDLGVAHRLGDPWARLVGGEDDRRTWPAEPAGDHRRIGVRSGEHAYTELIGTHQHRVSTGAVVLRADRIDDRTPAVTTRRLGPLHPKLTDEGERGEEDKDPLSGEIASDPVAHQRLAGATGGNQTSPIMIGERTHSIDDRIELMGHSGVWGPRC